MGRIEERMRIFDPGEIPVPEDRDLLVQARADARHLGLADTDVNGEAPDLCLDFAVGNPMQIRLQHDWEECLVDASAAFQQRREGVFPAEALESSDPGPRQSWTALTAIVDSTHGRESMRFVVRAWPSVRTGRSCRAGAERDGYP